MERQAEGTWRLARTEIPPPLQIIGKFCGHFALDAAAVCQHRRRRRRRRLVQEVPLTDFITPKKDWHSMHKKRNERQLVANEAQSPRLLGEHLRPLNLCKLHQ